MQWKYSLHAYATADLAYSKGLVGPRAFPLDDHSLENLRAFLVAFPNQDVYLHRVARREIRNLAL